MRDEIAIIFLGLFFAIGLNTCQRVEHISDDLSRIDDNLHKVHRSLEDSNIYARGINEDLHQIGLRLKDLNLTIIQKQCK